MGHQTTFRLEWTDDFPHILQVAQVLALTAFEHRGKDPSENRETPRRMDAATQHWASILTGEEETTWYEHEADMAHVSALWHRIEFNLYLIGEDAESCALEYYRGGLVQYAPARVEYPEFDFSLLTKPEGEPKDVKRPDTFFHLGWLARAQTGGYWAVPMATAAPPGSTGTETKAVPPSQGLLLEAPSREEAVRMISSWSEGRSEGWSEGWKAGPGPWQTAPRSKNNPAARAKQAVLDAVREASQTADPETALAISEWVRTAVLPGD